MNKNSNMFLRANIRENGIPFELKLNNPNSETIKAIEEGRRVALDINIKAYDSIEDLKKELEIYHIKSKFLSRIV